MEDRHFEYIERSSHDAVIKTENKRAFGQKYRRSMPIMSDDQSRVCFPRFSVYGSNETNQAGIIDVYDCSGEAGEFWMSHNSIDIDDEFYLYSLRVPENDINNFNSVQFSSQSRFVSVLTKRRVIIFDTESENFEEMEDADGECIKFLGEFLQFSVKNQTYDRILGMFIDEENVNQSWVVLQSSQYSQIHLVRLQSILDDER